MSRLLSPEEEARIFSRLRMQMARNIVRQAKEEARLRVSVVLSLSFLFWVGLFVLFSSGFRLIESLLERSAIRDQTYEIIFDIFFVSLLVMLVFSAGIILYSSLYRSRDAEFLLTVPVRNERIFLYKFQEAVLFSSWGFILLGTPMLVAYGMVTLAPWYYFVVLLPFIVAFVHIPAAVGAIVCMAIVRWLPRARMQAVIVAVGLVVGGTVYLGSVVLGGPEGDLLTPGWFQDMLARLSFSKNRLLPSWWLSHGLLEAARGGWSESVLFLVLLISNALFTQLVAVWFAASIYRSGYTALRGRKAAQRRYGGEYLDRIFDRLLWFLPGRMRLLVIKDLRLFRRDPVQWSQYVIFFGLLAMYFLNMRRFSYDVTYVAWVNVVSFLNLGVVGLILSIFTSRFVFPMISLEGKRFWILGLLPIHRETVLWSKFWFATAGSLLPATLLVLISDYMLQVETIIVVSHFITCVFLATGLAGIAVGLGATLPNLREESPSKITSGFGGTLNQVLSTLYIVVATMLPAVPCHFYIVAKGAGNPMLVYQGTAAAAALGIAATVVPMWIGFRAFRRLEF